LKEIFFDKGTHYEKLSYDEAFYKENNIEDESLHIRGAGMDVTTISWSDGGFDKSPDDRGIKLGTFRSYTMFVSGRDVLIEDITIENASGDGRIRGQGIALYADAESVTCRRVHLKGHQDTLFMSPLPLTEREKGGFIGPRENSPRLMTTQYYEDCIIEGDVDFIFGGANATFKNCTIVSLYRAPLIDKNTISKEKAANYTDVPVQGFVCAPCTPETETGIRFIDCKFITDRCPEGSVYLARPWREYGGASFENCSFGNHIHPDLFAGWKDVHKLESTARFTNVCR
jgi:pectinesterase